MILAAEPVLARLHAEMNPGAITLCLRSPSTRRGFGPRGRRGARASGGRDPRLGSERSGLELRKRFIRTVKALAHSGARVIERRSNRVLRIRAILLQKVRNSDRIINEEDLGASEKHTAHSRMPGIIVGGAFKIVAESDDDLHRVSHKLMGSGLAYLGLATLVENLG